MQRRQFIETSAAALLSTSRVIHAQPAQVKPSGLKYIVGSCMYGCASVKDILPEVNATGAAAIDIWPLVHGNQREQLSEMGEEEFSRLLSLYKVSLGCITQYKLGPFGLQDEMRLASRLNCSTIVTGASGPRGLTGSELKAAVRSFIEKMKPHLAVAEETGVTIAIENHGNNLIESPDSLRYLAELRPSASLGIAFAPYHLPQDSTLLADLIRELGETISMFYAWQHGKGCMSKQPKQDELLQMPGRGSLDFAPLMIALREIKYQGWTEIFMHPYPRGIAIMESIKEVTTEIIRSKDYLETLNQH